MIDRLIKEGDGEFCYKDPSGCSWDTPLEFLCIGILPSCGCGDPASIGRYVRGMLVAHTVKTSGVQGEDNYSPWDSNDYDDLPVMFFLSWADREGYIEHGTTIRCSWRTEKGEELLQDLNTCLADEAGGKQ